MVEIIGPVVMTIIIGAIDHIFWLKICQVTLNLLLGTDWVHLIPIGILTAIAFNISLLDPLGIALLSNKYITLTLLAIVGAIIVHAKSAAFKGARGVGSHETWAHSFIIAILIAASPFIYPLISTYLPI